MEPNDIYNTWLKPLGGIGAIVAGVGVVVKMLLDRHLAKGIEVLKLTISHENAAAIERLKAELEAENRNEERSYEYAQVMHKYQGPLQHAIYDLQSRIYNIVCNGLVEAYVVNGKKHEREYVIGNTIFVIAQYFTWTEIIRSEIQFIDCETSENTRKLAELQDNIYSLWQTDELNDCLRIWAGEQRAIGETLIELHDGKRTCMGYAKFLELIEAADSSLISRLYDDLVAASGNMKNVKTRLVPIQHALIDLLEFLDPEFMRFPRDRRSYV